MSPMRRTLAVSLTLAFFGAAFAQEILSDMPRFDRYDKLRKERANAFVSGAIANVRATANASLRTCVSVVIRSGNKAIR